MQIAQTQDFNEWFKASCVVDGAGNPLVVYHGTAIEKTVFRRDGGCAGVGAYFTPDRLVAQDYAELDASIDGDDPLIMHVYLSIQNPYRMVGGSSQSITAAQRDAMEAQGYDGVIGEFCDGIEYVAFQPDQIKIIEVTG